VRRDQKNYKVSTGKIKKKRYTTAEEEFKISSEKKTLHQIRDLSYVIHKWRGKKNI
jgi:hypothetical protein